LLLMAAVLALKVAVVAAAATVTDAGTVRVALVLLRVTLAPPVGATWVMVTVQVLDEFGPRLVGLQTSEETSTGATRLMLALAELLL
jgi:ABC-type sugar transport system substrate-binding protein